MESATLPHVSLAPFAGITIRANRVGSTSPTDSGQTVAAFWPVFILSFPELGCARPVTVEDVQKQLQPIGLSRRLAPSLHMLANIMAKHRGRFPLSRETIDSLPGVGQYIGNAVMLFCHGKPLPLLDGNMARVIERFFGARKLVDIRYDPYLQGTREAHGAQQPC